VAAALAWSYSALTSYETCPWRYKLTKRTKQVQEPQTQATIAGNEVHKALELHVKGTQWLPEKYRQWVPLVERIKKQPGQTEAERKFALSADFRETTYFAKDVWLRGVFDIVNTQPKEVTALDWKTGKRKHDADQLKLFAGAAFKLYPHVDTVKTGYVWLKDKKIDRETFTRDQEPAIWREFMIRVQRIEESVATDNFPKRPSGLCREWCPVGKKLCEHCGT
jgi:hypothetical protein